MYMSVTGAVFQLSVISKRSDEISANFRYEVRDRTKHVIVIAMLKQNLISYTGVVLKTLIYAGACICPACEMVVSLVHVERIVRKRCYDGSVAQVRT
jgi:hypothetical protein